MQNKHYSTWPHIVVFCLAALLICPTASAQPPADMQRLSTLLKQLKTQIQEGENREAAATIAETMAIGERLMGPSNPDIIRMGNQRAVLLRNAGDLDDAMQQANNTLRSAEQHLDKDHPVYAAAKMTVGTIYRLQGNLEKARPFYKDSIEILEKLGQPGEKDLAEAYVNMADFMGETGDVAASRDYGQQSLALTSRLFGPDSVQAATATNNLGMALMKLGDMGASEATLKKALALYEKLYGPDHAEIASSLNNLGLLYMKRGRYPDATAAYQRAAIIADAKLGKNSALAGLIKNNLGQLLSEMGDNAAAQPLLEEALALRTEIFGDSHPSVGITLHNLGCAMKNRRDYANGRRKLTKAITIITAAHGDEHPQTAESWANLGMLETADDKPAAAMAAFEKSRAIATAAAWKVLPQLNSNEQQNFMKRTFEWTLFTSLGLAEKYPDNQTVLQNTAQWLANGKGVAETALAADRSERGDISLKQVTLEEVRQAIPADGVLIDIIRQNLYDYAASSYEECLLDPHYIAWIIPPQGDIARVDLGDAAAIESLVEAARNELMSAANPGGALVTENAKVATERVEEKLRALADVIWKPIEEKISGDPQRIIFSPDGALWLVPWNALPVAKAKDEDSSGREYRWLIEQYAISTTASGRELVLGSGSAEPNKSTPTIFSNPDFDQSETDKRSSYKKLFPRRPQPAHRSTRSWAFDASRYQVSPLPGTEVESKAITAPMQTWLDGVKPHIFRGPYALESVAKQLERPRSLVFATHGFFTPANDRDSDVADANRSADPLERCGLLLCGCNDSSSAIGDDDGVLTGVEITAIDLRSTELVVLSACDTGVGKIENGNGIAGLRRAFHLAGAKAVAATLWQIPDRATADLMTRFFNQLAKGDSKDDAIRTAQIGLIESLRERDGAAHPFFWAAFGINGR